MGGNVIVLSYLRGILWDGVGEGKLLVSRARPIGDKQFMLISSEAPPGRKKEKRQGGDPHLLGRTEDLLVLLLGLLEGILEEVGVCKIE